MVKSFVKNPVVKTFMSVGKALQQKHLRLLINAMKMLDKLDRITENAEAIRQARKDVIAYKVALDLID